MQTQDHDYRYSLKNVTDALLPVLYKDGKKVPKKEKQTVLVQLSQVLAQNKHWGVRDSKGRRPRFTRLQALDLAAIIVIKGIPTLYACKKLPMPHGQIAEGMSGYGLDKVEGYCEDWELRFSYQPSPATDDGSGATMIRVLPRTEGNERPKQVVVDGQAWEQIALAEIRINLWWMSGFLKNLETQSGGQ